MSDESTSVLLLQAVDVSGSMSGETMSGINVAFQEWRAELEAYRSTLSQKIFWGEIRFAESVTFMQPQAIEYGAFTGIQIPGANDGNYETSEFAVLARALEDYLSNPDYAYATQGNSRVVIRIFTDGLGTDEDLDEALKSLDMNEAFAKAEKKIVVCGEANSLKQYSNRQLGKITSGGQMIEKISYEDFLKEKGNIIGEMSSGNGSNDIFASAFD